MYKGAMALQPDSTSARLIATNPVFNERMKHFDVDVHFVRENIESNCIRVQYLHTSIPLVDFLTSRGKNLKMYVHKKFILFQIFFPLFPSFFFFPFSLVLRFL